MEDTDAKWMKNSKKMVYMGHHRFLSLDHPYRKNKKSFFGITEDSQAPQTLTMKDILTKVNKLKVILGKGKGSKQAPSSSMFEKKSIFWDLSYWRFMDVRHALDGMHITKNMTEILLGTLMEAKGKGKDSLSTRLDLQELKSGRNYILNFNLTGHINFQ